MATYNPGHGAGGGAGGGSGIQTAAHQIHQVVPAAGPSHPLPLAGASLHSNGALGIDVFDHELNFDESLL